MESQDALSNLNTLPFIGNRGFYLEEQLFSVVLANVQISANSEEAFIICLTCLQGSQYHRCEVWPFCSNVSSFFKELDLPLDLLQCRLADVAFNIIVALHFGMMLKGNQESDASESRFNFPIKTALEGTDL